MRRAGAAPAQAYNLVYQGAGAAPAPPDESGPARRLAAAAKAWGRAMRRGERGAGRMMLSLEHQYTEANLSFSNLKVEASAASKPGGAG